MAMKRCPVCKNHVKEFKSGCHVIPRWAMKMTKENGHYASLDLRDKKLPSRAKAKTDLVCKLWCDSCEKRFSRDDANGARFFRQKKYLIREIRPRPGTEEVGVEVHSSDALDDLRSFVVSLFIRNEIYFLNTEGRGALGPRFEFYARAHRNKELDGKNCSLVLQLHTAIGPSHSSISRTKFGNRRCVLLVFCGYDMLLVSDSRGPENSIFSELITDREIVIAAYGGLNMPSVRFLKDAVDRVKNSKS